MTNKELINYGIEAGQFPKYLYKFFSINEFFVDSIKNSYIWFSKPLDFNDPFDGNISLQWDGTLEQYEKYLEGAAQGRLTPDKIKEYAKKMYENPKIAKDFLDRIVSETVNLVGVACFSEINNNILMWSHYTNSHKGVCIKYDLGKMVSDHHFLVKVKYAADYPLHNYMSQGNHSGLSNVVIGTKSNDWSYEREFRLLSITLGKNVIPKDSVAEVILGCRCDEEQTILNLFNSSGYKPTYLKANTKKNYSFGLDFVNYP